MYYIFKNTANHKEAKTLSSLFNYFSSTKSFNLNDIVKFIRSCQKKDGAIYWYKGAKLDPWDHTEAAMALSIGGDLRHAEKAYQWLMHNQNADGSWYARYDADETRHLEDHWKVESHFVAYPITGIWHHYLITRDLEFLNRFFPMVRSAANYVISQQGPEGEVQWAVSEKQDLPKDALVTGCSSILRSLECATRIADQLGHECRNWYKSYRALADALMHKPRRFDRSWESKSRYSMDWFYPVLAGIYNTNQANARLDKHWSKFIEPEFGCRCVADEPWVTTAESCELVISLVACNKPERAHSVFKWINQWNDGRGAYWTGYNYRDKNIWPEEKTSWSAAAVALAADALFKLSPASTLFTRHSRIL